GYSGLLSVPEPTEWVGIRGGYGRAGEGVGRHVYYEEASEPTNVPARRRHRVGPAAAGRDDPRGDCADAHRRRGAPALRSHLHAERHLSGPLASGEGRQELRVQPYDEAA